MERARLAIARWLGRPRAILLAGWLVFVVYAYPGLLPDGAVDQLIDARYGSFTDWHPPVMTEVWRIVGFAIAGPFGMLALQSGLVLVGSFVLLRRHVSPRRAAVASACVLVFPPVMATLAVIGPDGQLAGFAIATAAAVTSPRRAVRIAGLGLAVIACGVRAGGAYAVLPIVVLGFTWVGGQRWWIRHGIAAAAWLGCAALAAGLASALVDLETGRPEATRATRDVVGILVHAGPIDDAELRALAPGVGLVATGYQQRARAIHATPSRYADGPDRVLDAPADLAGVEALVAARDRLRRAYPWAYVAARWHQLRQLLGLADAERWRPVITSPIAKSLRTAAVHATQRSRVQRLLQWPVRALGDTVVFTPYLYFALAIPLLVVAIRRRRRDVVALLASALALEAFLFVGAPDVDFRYAQWLITATALAGAALIARALHEQDHRRHAHGDDHPVRVPEVGLDADRKEAELVAEAAQVERERDPVAAAQDE